MLETSLRLIHPLMPYLTEDLWQRTPRPSSRRSSIAFGPYPTAKADGLEDEAALREMEIFKGVVSAARTIRSEHQIHPRRKVPLALRADSEQARALLEARKDGISLLVKCSAATVEKTGGIRAAGTTTSVLPSSYGSVEVHLGLMGFVTRAEELTRIDREMKKIDKDLASIEKKMSSKNFLERAPKEVIDETNALKEQLLAARVRHDESRVIAVELSDTLEAMDEAPGEQDADGGDDKS